MPLMAAEFINASAEYAVVFAGSEDAVMPAVILGVRDQQNLYLNEDGSWQGKYIPAFIRRYPFVFSSSEDGSTFTLCIDEDFSGCNQDGRGERLFDSQGERTQYLQNVLGFLQAFQAQFQRTQAFCRKIKELDLLEPMQAQFRLGSGEQMSLTGFMTISRDKLKALSGDQLADLARTDELELLYAHLHSLRNFTPMIERVAGPAGPTPAADDETAPAAPNGEEKKPSSRRASKTAEDRHRWAHVSRFRSAPVPAAGSSPRPVIVLSAWHPRDVRTNAGLQATSCRSPRVMKRCMDRNDGDPQNLALCRHPY